MAPLILVTGISGFIGSETALTALEQGNRVRGAVRRKEQGDAFFSRYPGISHDQLEFVVVEDITAEGAWDAAVVGVDFVVHTASPVGASDVKDRAKELLDPAIKGTTSLLHSAVKGLQIQAVVITSSCVAFLDFRNLKGQDESYSETDWNSMTYAEALDPKVRPFVAYTASKALAERAAWDFVKERNPSFRLVTIAPTWTLGPSRQPTLFRISDLPPTLSDTWTALVDQKGPVRDPPFPHFVDVRDVALALLAACTNPAANGRRFVLAGGRLSYTVASQILASEFPEQAHRLQLGGDLAFGETFDWEDSLMAEDILGIEYTRLGATVKDMGAQLFALPA